MKKFFIIEDNKKDFQSLYNLIKENFSDPQIYPSNLEESNYLKNQIKALFSAKHVISKPARDFLNSLKINEYDVLILDYELWPSMKLVTGIQLYQELDIKTKALILTKYSAVDYDGIIKLIKSQGLTDMILVKQKGSLVVLSEEQKKEHINNINSHFFNIISEAEIKKQIIDILTKNKPKIIAAITEILRETANITEEIIKKINDSKLNLTEELLIKLDESNEIEYLKVLKEINSQCHVE